MVIVLSFFSNDLSSNSVKFVFENTENKLKRGRGCFVYSDVSSDSNLNQLMFILRNNGLIVVNRDP